MKKVWIIYNTKHGNCKALSEKIGDKLSENFEVKIASVKNLSPEDIVSTNPDALLVGARITIASPDKKVKKFVRKLGKILEEPIPKGATFYTHLLDWREKYSKMASELKVGNVCNEICPEVLNVRMQGMKGPAIPEQDDKINKFIESVAGFI